MLKAGIVGLPNAGKSTLFNALVKGNQAMAANFPFCTIDPNIGIVDVPDTRLNQLAAIVDPKKIIPAAIEFVDIAGLVAGAHKGEGLGNTFLSHIKAADAILIVLRAFTDPDVTHVYGSVDPVRDYETLMLELILSDLGVVTSAYERAERAAHDGTPATKARHTALAAIKTTLEQNKPVSEMADADPTVLKELQLLSAKPRLLVFNIGEDTIADPTSDSAITEWITKGRAISADFNDGHVLYVSSKLEAELINLPTDEQAEFLDSYGLSEPSLHAVIAATYTLLGLQSFFTAGPQEVRAWTIPVGATAPQAAGVIHTDFEERFIRAEVIGFADYIAHNGEAGAREKGKLRSEGRDYIVADGDVLHIRFSPS